MSQHFRRLLALVLALNLGAAVSVGQDQPMEAPSQSVMAKEVQIRLPLPWSLSSTLGSTPRKRASNQPMLGLAVYNRLQKQALAFDETEEETSDSGLPCLHLVAEGESLSQIASMFGTVPQAIMRANDIKDPNMIIAGTFLFIPQPISSELQVVTVNPGDTMESFSQKFGLTVEALCRLNGLEEPESITERQRLIVPSLAIDWQRPTQTVSRSLRSTSAATASISFAWPLTGWLTSTYGWRNDRMHYGIDVAASYGTIVRAAADGVVEFAGWRGSYGMLVILQHQDNWRTYYSHNSRLLVEEGQTVTGGQAIAEVGSTGRATGNHLHFEVHHGEQRLNPLTVLPNK